MPPFDYHGQTITKNLNSSLCIALQEKCHRTSVTEYLKLPTQ